MYEGLTTALITPFLENQEVNYDGYRKNIHYQIKSGVEGLLTLGTTGETPTLTEQEQENLISATVEEANNKAFVVVGTGTNSTLTTIKKTKRAYELGADAALVVTPYYNKPTAEGIYQHFKAVAEASNIPIIVYNIQGRTGKNIETNLLQRLSTIPNIVAVKEASGNINQMGDVIEQICSNSDFTMLSGDDGITLPLMSLGGKGVISVISNAIPKQMSEFVNFAYQGNFAEARRLHFEIVMPMTRAAFIETNPIPIKYICTRLGLAGGSYRLPMCEMHPENKQKVDEILKQLNLAGAYDEKSF